MKWAGPTSEQWQFIASHGFSSHDGRLQVNQNGLLRHSGGGGNHGAEATLSQGEWTHIAATYDRSISTSAIYLDGVLAASKSSGFSSAMVGTFWFAGTGDYPEDYPFKGSMFAARVSDSVRYSSDFTPDLAPFDADASSIGVWNMADLNGSNVPDSTTNGFDLSVVGGSASTDCPTTGSDRLGSVEDNPGITCVDILGQGDSTGDSTYWIDPDGSGAFQAYCDMTTDGGGWTLVGSFVNSDGSVSWSRPVGDTHWRSTSTFGDVLTYQSADFKSEAFSTVSGPPSPSGIT